MQYYHLAEKYEIEAVGSFAYRASFETVYGPPPPGRRTTLSDNLELIAETDNPHDPSAVAVTRLGHKLGYLPREVAAQFHSEFLKMLNAGIVPLAVAPRIHVRWASSNRKSLDAWITLHLPEPGAILASDRQLRKAIRAAEKGMQPNSSSPIQSRGEDTAARAGNWLIRSLFGARKSKRGKEKGQ